jgi:molybdate transport repressor ModE-like protein
VLDVRRLHLLREVARHGSLSAAARALDYSQPAVSHHIARLEEELGTPLLLREGRGVRLTEAGQTLCAHADEILGRMAVAEEEMAALSGLRAGRVRLGAFPSATATLLPPAIAQLRRLHPGLELSLVEEEPPEALALLRAGELDLAVVFSYPEVDDGSDGDVVSVPLVDDPLVAVLPGDHPCAGGGSGGDAGGAGGGSGGARGSAGGGSGSAGGAAGAAGGAGSGAGGSDGGERLRLAELADETWIAGCDRCRAHLLHACAEAGFAPRIAFATDDHVAVQALVAAGVGVALLPSLGLRAARRPDVAVRELAGRPVRSVYAVTPRAARRPPAVQAMLEQLVVASAG